MPVSSLPHPNLYLMNQFLGLASTGGRRNIYTMDTDHQEKEQRDNVRNVTIGYVVAQRGGGGQGTRAGDQKRICFIYMKVILSTIILILWKCIDIHDVSI